MLRLNTTIFIRVFLVTADVADDVCQVDPLDDARGLQSSGDDGGVEPRGPGVEGWKLMMVRRCISVSVCCMLTRSSSLQDDKG